jgi:hypothetical protein
VELIFIALKLLYDAFAVPHTVSVNFSAEGGILNFSLWEKLANDIQVIGYLILCHSDAPNPCHLQRFCTEDHYRGFHSE